MHVIALSVVCSISLVFSGDLTQLVGKKGLIAFAAVAGCVVAILLTAVVYLYCRKSPRSHDAYQPAHVMQHNQFQGGGYNQHPSTGTLHIDCLYFSQTLSEVFPQCVSKKVWVKTGQYVKLIKAFTTWRIFWKVLLLASKTKYTAWYAKPRKHLVPLPSVRHVVPCCFSVK